MKIDFRSDTLTAPTQAMRRAMLEAEVGDDVYGEDPTVNLLQEKAAAVTGKEAALFVPTGSMGNCVCLLTHCRPGTEVICESSSHVANHELASMCTFGGLFPRTVTGKRGRMDLDEVEHQVRPEIYYMSQTGAIALENTHNMAGGTVLDEAYLKEARALADRHGLPIHMDGARIFNAATCLGVPVKALAQYADSIMFCLSKGLCAPIGSLIAGSREFIEKARVHRKRLGGGMRQAGVLAAPGLVALETLPPLLVEDHEKIRKIAAFLSQYDFITIDGETVQTNILILRVNHREKTAADLGKALEGRGILCHVFGDAIRIVAYRDIRFDMVDRSIEIMAEVFSGEFL